MIVEVTRLIDRWLSHVDYGVAPMLETISRNLPGGGEDDEPIVPMVYNDIESDRLTTDLEPPTSPALVVLADTLPTSDAKDSIRQISQNVIVTVWYITRDMPAADVAVQGNYVLRAVKKSLTRYNDQGLSAGYRELNGFKIAAVGKVSIRRVAGAVGESQLWGFTSASLLVIDSEP